MLREWDYDLEEYLLNFIYKSLVPVFERFIERLEI